jgi:hypothetical protein
MSMSISKLELDCICNTNKLFHCGRIKTSHILQRGVLIESFKAIILMLGCIFPNMYGDLYSKHHLNSIPIVVPSLGKMGDKD